MGQRGSVDNIPHGTVRVTHPTIERPLLMSSDASRYIWALFTLKPPSLAILMRCEHPGHEKHGP